MNKTFPKVFSVITILALMLAALPVQGAKAAISELFFSEYIEGSSNNKALEIYNGTGSAINLGTGGYNVQMYFNGSGTAGLTINLTGTVAAGDVFVLAQSTANATILAQADQTNGAGWFNGNDAVVLRKGTTIIDVIGQIGFDPVSQWGSGLTSTADNTLRRKSTIEAGDNNGTDPFDPATEWDGFANDTFCGLGYIYSDCAPAVASTVPANGAGNVPLNSNISVTFTEAVTVSGSWFTISCATSGSHTATVSGGPTTYLLNVDTDFFRNEICTMTVVAANVTDTDTNDPPDAMNADHVFSFSTVELCTDPATSIHNVQGGGLASPVAGNVVAVQGIVVGDFQGSGGLSGYYIQEEDVQADADPATSEGIFVFNTSFNVNVGDEVRVRGTATEFNGLTEISGVSNSLLCSSGNALPATSSVNLPLTSIDDFEKFEGMRVLFPQALVISEYFNYDRLGEMVLALPLAGETRPFTGTAIDEPGAPALARALANSLRRITLDDGLSSQNPSSLRHPNGNPFSLSNRFRGGDTVQNAVGVLDFSFGLYRIQPTAAATYTAVNPRPASPAPVGGSLRVAAMNTLNFFITADYPNTTPVNSLDNKCGPLNNVECRGWDSDQATEFTRQRDKLLAALAGLNADVIGLNEMENSTGVEPLADIVAGLNTMLGPGTYDYIDTGTIGTDAIKVGLIYKPAKVTPFGDFKILDSTIDPDFIDTLNRPVLAQTFEEVATGARITVAVNHLKSKGSDCNAVGDPDAGDGQGNCNLTRKAAAEALVDWLATDPTGSGDKDFLIIGDLNSYDKEDPIDAILAGGYTDLIYQYLGEYAYSYVFDGQSGYLDHALAGKALLNEVTGATEWHINADEPDVLDYDTSFKPGPQDALYEPNAFRSSDHDPVIVGLNLCTDETNPTFDVLSVTPNVLWPANHKYVDVQATVEVSDNFDPDPTVTLVSVTSNEPDNGDDDGDTIDDIFIVDDFTFQLRAERSGVGTGRVYTITYTVTDACGNSTTASATVTVPLSQGK